MKSALVGVAMLLVPSVGMAQDKVEVDLSADLVSNYIWRGSNCGGVSIQPSLSVSYKGFSVEAWGNVGFDSEDVKEIDLTVGYEVGGFSVSVTDYWFETTDGVANKFLDYKAHSTAHVLEAQVGYDFGPVALNWYTNFAGADGVNKDGDRAYSSYITATAPFTLGGLEWEAEIGATPWANDYYGEDVNGFAVCDISLSASKELKITESFSLPVYGKLSVNPNADKAFFAFGMTF